MDALTDLTRELPANLGAALALVPALEWLKRNKALGWINHETVPLISIMAAALIAAGIHSSYDAAQGVVTITGLTGAGLAQAVLEIGKQYLGQHWVHSLYQAVEATKKIAAAADVFLNPPIIGGK